MDLELKLRKSLNTDKLNKIEDIQNKIIPLINRTTNINIDFTEHDIKHALQVEDSYTKFFPNIESILEEEEKYLLIIATLIHDIGMVGQSKFRFEKDYDTEIRASHNYRSGDFIREYNMQLGIMDREARVIEKIAEAHRVVHLDSLPKSEPFGRNKNIRIRLLAGLLRLADELDILEERAPQLVKDFLNVNPESAKHFNIHRAIQGIALVGDTIEIVAYIQNFELEAEVWKVYEQINKKFEEVKPILLENNIILNSIKMHMNTKEVTKKEIMLFLACKDKVDENDIYQNFKNKRPNEEIKEAIKELHYCGFIEEANNWITLSLKDRHFNCLKDNFIDTKFELDFTKSIYLKKYIEKKFDSYVREKFGVHYNRGQRKDRINILTHIPTSIKYFFDEGNTPYNIGTVDRRVTLELGLLHALSIDALKYPSQLTEEIILSAQAIEQDVNNQLYSFLRLISAIPEAEKRKKGIIDKSLIGENIETHPEQKGSFKIVSKYSNNQLKNTDFLTLYLASSISGQPVHFAKDIELRDIQFNGLYNEDLNTQDLVSISLVPNKKFQTIEIDTFFKIEMNEIENELCIILSITDKENISEYPYGIYFRLTEEGEIKFKFSCSNVRCFEDINKYNKMMKIWKNKGFRRFYIKDNEGNIPIKTVLSKNRDVEVNNYFNKLKIIVENAGESIDYIPLESLYNYKLKGIEKLKLDELKSKDEFQKLLKDIKKDVYKEQTIVNLYLINQDNNYIISVSHLDNIPYLFDMSKLQIDVIEKNKKEEILKDINKGRIGITLEKYISKLSPIEMYKQIKNIFISENKAFDKSLSYIISNESDVITGKVRVEFNKVYKDFWHDKIQEVNIKVYICESEVSKINELIKFLSEDNFIEAIPIMEEFKNKNFVQLENLAYAYCLNKEYDKSINLCNDIIKKDYKSIAHFTKGLALVLKGDTKKAYESYMYGMHLIKKEIWMPHIKVNLLREIEKNGIREDNNIKKILNNIEIFSRSKMNNRFRRCFCGSNKSFKKCHEKVLINTIKTNM